MVTSEASWKMVSTLMEHSLVAYQVVLNALKDVSNPQLLPSKLAWKVATHGHARAIEVRDPHPPGNDHRLNREMSGFWNALDHHYESREGMCAMMEGANWSKREFPPSKEHTVPHLMEALGALNHQLRVENWMSDQSKTSLVTREEFDEPWIDWTSS